MSKAGGGAGETVPDCGQWEQFMTHEKATMQGRERRRNLAAIGVAMAIAKARQFAHRVVQARASGNGSRPQW